MLLSIDFLSFGWLGEFNFVNRILDHLLSFLEVWHINHRVLKPIELSVRIRPHDLNLGFNVNVKLVETLFEATMRLLHPTLQFLMTLSELLDRNRMCRYLGDLRVNKLGQLVALHEGLVVPLFHLIDACL